MGFKDWFKKDKSDVVPVKPVHSEEYNKMFELYKGLMSQPADNPYRITHELLRRACRGKNMRFLYDDDYEYTFYSPVLLRPIKVKNVDGRKVYVKIGDGVWVPFDGMSLTALRAVMLVNNVRRQRDENDKAIADAIQAEICAKIDAATRELCELHAHVLARTSNRTR